jgi:hypothetical protein
MDHLELQDLETMRNPTLWNKAPLKLRKLKKVAPAAQFHWGYLTTAKNGGYVFARQSSPFLPDMDTPRTGGDELLLNLIVEGWEVDEFSNRPMERGAL